MLNLCHYVKFRSLIVKEWDDPENWNGDTWAGSKEGEDLEALSSTRQEQPPSLEARYPLLGEPVLASPEGSCLVGNC